jgi:hypothetical protein
MFTSEEQIIEVLETRTIGICDDCLSEIAAVKPRQQVNSICRKLQIAGGKLQRVKGECPECKKNKILNSIKGIETDLISSDNLYLSTIRETSPQYETISWDAAADLDAIRRHIIEMMNKLDPQKRPSSIAVNIEQFSEKLKRLEDAEIIPNPVAIIVRMLNSLRNAVVYHECRLGKQERELINQAYQYINLWWTSLKNMKPEA